MGNSEEQKLEIVNSSKGSMVKASESEQKVLDAMARYQDAREQYLSVSSETDSAIQPPGLTEEMRLSLKLQGERLKNQNLSMDTRQEWQVSSKKGDSFLQKPEFIKDGESLVGHLRNRMKIHTSFLRGKKGQVGSFEENLVVDYILLENGSGGLQVLSETKREQVEVFGSDCEYWNAQRWILETLGIKFYLFALESLILFHVGSFLVFVLGTFTHIMHSHQAGALGFFVWIITFFGLLLMGAHCFRMFPSYKRRRASAQVVQRIREAIPDFCRGTFVSMAESRIKSLFFADTLDQVGEFVNGNVHGILKTHAYAVNYESRNFWFQNFWQDMDNLHIEVVAEAFISNDNGNYISRNREYIKVHFTKPLNGIMAGDWYVEKVEVANKYGK